MAKYYAVVKDNYVQKDINTGQLEIYETKKQAKMNCPKTCSVIAVEVKRKQDHYIGGPVDNTKPDWWEDDDYKPFDDPSYERTYFDN